LQLPISREIFCTRHSILSAGGTMLSVGWLQRGCCSWHTAAAVIALGATPNEGWQYFQSVLHSPAEPLLVGLAAIWRTPDDAARAAATNRTSNVIPSYTHQSPRMVSKPRMLSTDLPLGSRNGSSDDQPSNGNGQVQLLRSRHATQTPVSQVRCPSRVTAVRLLFLQRIRTQ
jgi:hypothetical protein